MDKNIYIFLQKIPKGKVVSYKQIWELFSIHPRTVAKILSRNINQDTYPCYKVVNSNWKINWYNLWVENKINKLKSDWIIIKNWKIDSKYFWNIPNEKTSLN